MPTNFDLAVRSSEESWRSLRQRRAQAPPAGAEPAVRAATFRAGLEQAEQQLRAAASVGYDSRALNLFYGLSQGGRALAAAAPSLSEQEWKLNGHGLRFPGGDSGSDVTTVQVETTPKKTASSFVRLSVVLDSPLTGPIALGQLWPLMYETTIAAPLGKNLHSPLDVFTGQLRPADRDDAHVGIDDVKITVPAAITRLPEEQRPSVRDFLARYPALDGAVGSERCAAPDGGLPLDWPEKDEQLSLKWPQVRDAHERPQHVLTERLALYRGQHFVLPYAPNSEKVLHPLMVWWQVLYALSMLTRYEPARWTKMIDVDSSGHAVAIEYVLDTALAAVPDLLDEALESLAAH